MTKNKNQALIPSAALSRVLNVVSRGIGRDGLYEMMNDLFTRLSNVPT